MSRALCWLGALTSCGALVLGFFAAGFVRDDARLTLQGHIGSLYTIAFSPDGRTVLAGGFSTSMNSEAVQVATGGIVVWDAATGREQLVLVDDLVGAVRALAIHPRGTRIVSTGGPTGLALWDLKTAAHCAFFEGGDGCLALSADGALLAAASNHDVLLFAYPKRTAYKHMGGQEGAVTSMAFSPDGATLASGNSDATIRLWDMPEGSERQVLRGHTGCVTSLAFAPDGALASGALDGTVRLWDAKSGQQRQVVELGLEEIRSIAFAPDGATLAALRESGLRLVDVASGKARSWRRRHEGATAVAFSPDGKTLATCSSDGTVKLWNVPGRD